MLKTQINALEAAKDIRAGMDDFALMEKYNVSSRGLQSLFKKLVAGGVLDQSELEHRRFRPEESVIIELGGPFGGDGEAGAAFEAAECILTISDDKELLDFIEEHLLEDGYRVITSEEDFQDTQALQKAGPDLVLVDTELLWEDVDRVIKLVEESEHVLPVILIADKERREQTIEAMSEGVHDFVEKPVHPHILRSRVRRALDYRRLARFHQNHRWPLDSKIGKAPDRELLLKDVFDGMVESSPQVSVIMTDLDQNVLFWNKGAESIFGYTAEEMLGEKVTKLYPQDSVTRNRVSQVRTGLLRSGETMHTRMKQLTRDGRVLSISLSVSVIRDRFGTPVAFLGFGLDITEMIRQSREVANLMKQLQNLQDVSVMTLAKLAVARGDEGDAHLTRIREFCRIIGEGLRQRERHGETVTAQYVEDLVRCSVLHDIGHVAVPDAALTGSDASYEGKREILAQHAVLGGSLLEEAVRRLRDKSFLAPAMEMAYYHHEKWDGSGYPFGIKEEAIPLSARILALVHAYDDLTTEKIQNRAMSHEEACQIISEGKGTQFDPELVEVFQEIDQQFRSVRTSQAAE